MYSKIALLVIAATISGCASVSTVIPDKGDLSRFAGQPVALKIAKPNSFVLSTPENNRTYLRTVTMVREGNELIESNGVSDPAEEIANAIGQRLEKAYGTKASSVNSNAMLSIDVQTTNWGLFFTSADKNKYGVIYTATVQIVDVQKGSVIASGYCKPMSGASIVADRGQFLDRSAEGLKTALAQLAQECVQYISSQVLAI